MRRVRWALIVGLATGIAGAVCAVIPLVSDLEDSVALPALFFTRGRVSPPEGVVLVSIDEATPTRLGLPPAVRDWPRSTHARVVEQLVAGGASAIAFDIQFFRHGDGDADRALADAIARSGRVVLVQRIEVGRTSGIEHWQWQQPIPVLADGAAGLAPVPMPDVPMVSWVWSFLSTPNAVDVPTLPAVMLQVRALPILPGFLDAVKRAGADVSGGLPHAAADVRGSPDLLRLMQELRNKVRGRAAAVSAEIVNRVADGGLSREDRRLLLALVDLYGGSSVRHLNFYGPPGSVCTIPYDVALNQAPGSKCNLNGAVVFVGLGAARVARSGVEDTYHTVYPASDGIDFSGVEIHATALANLIDGSTLRPAAGPALVGALMAVGLMLGATAYWVRTRRRWTKGATRCRLQAAAVTVALSIAYCGVVYAAFREYYLVLPIVVPLLVQLPVAVVLGLLAPPAAHREEVRAVCLATDAGGSTALGQHMPPRALRPVDGRVPSDAAQHRAGERRGTCSARGRRPRLRVASSQRQWFVGRGRNPAACVLRGAPDRKGSGALGPRSLTDRQLPTRIGLNVCSR